MDSNRFLRQTALSTTMDDAQENLHYSYNRLLFYFWTKQNASQSLIFVCFYYFESPQFCSLKSP